MSARALAALQSAAEAGPALLSVIIPTFNEAGNVREILARLDRTLAGIAWEAIFVDDDSPDHTAETVKAVAAADARVRCLKRLGRRGLAGACIEGMMASSAPYVAVMDADLQHDERILPSMLAALMADSADLVVGSRYVRGGSADSFSADRARFSRAATGLTRRLLGVDLADPMSGFFMLKRDKLDEIAGELSPVGFKILLDIVLTAKHRLRVTEIPYEFRQRRHGQSKFDAAVGFEFIGLALAKMTGGAVGPRFISFGLVGTTGLAVHLVVLKLAFESFALNFAAAQSVATFVAMASNFLLNNLLTYHDRRLSGKGLIFGFLGFCLIGSVGALTNIGLASWLYSREPTWWLAGAAGAIMGALWNYSMSSQFVWRTR
ncbi:MAG TPA: glycosyltransferase family 2 protein [Rhizomicrobium sp.]|nr:glycosyltransferase family 2 protein [Rhizomicrobium sp.]